MSADLLISALLILSLGVLCVWCALGLLDTYDEVTHREDAAGAREIRHPSMAPTREYLAANPLPTQQNRSAS